MAISCPTFAQQIPQLRLDFWPFAACQTVHHGVAYGAVASHGVAAYDTIFFGTQTLYGTLAGKVEIVCAPAHYVVAQSFKSLMIMVLSETVILPVDLLEPVNCLSPKSLPTPDNDTVTIPGSGSVIGSMEPL